MRTFAVEYDSLEAFSNDANGLFPGGQPMGFQGQYTDPVLGFLLTPNRVYDARNGVWLSQDPMEDRDSPNLYGFVGGRPHEKTDPLGLRALNQADKDYIRQLNELNRELRGEYARAGTFRGAKISQSEYEHGLADVTAMRDTYINAVWDAADGQAIRSDDVPMSFWDPRKITKYRPQPTEEQIEEGNRSAYKWVFWTNVVPNQIAIFASPHVVNAGPRMVEQQQALRPPGEMPKRRHYMGDTPGKGSATGQEVLERMAAAGRVRTGPSGGMEIQGSDGAWVPIEQTDMSHIEGAVTWWNREGYRYGPRAPEVRQWMRDPNNYELEPSGPNRARGGQTRERYRPPAPLPGESEE
ncbi:MAG: hypothetical protein IPL89_16835 [Acidobacteria bacterium]|nr:hypothetical protein [Acidobacteriota bacterium]